MKIKDMISILKQFDDEAEVKIEKEIPVAEEDIDGNEQYRYEFVDASINSIIKDGEDVIIS